MVMELSSPAPLQHKYFCLPCVYADKKRPASRISVFPLSSGGCRCADCSHMERPAHIKRNAPSFRKRTYHARNVPGAHFGKRLLPKLSQAAENTLYACRRCRADLLCEQVARYEFFLPCADGKQSSARNACRRVRRKIFLPWAAAAADNSMDADVYTMGACRAQKS